jgi:hypothetical protein
MLLEGGEVAEDSMMHEKRRAPLDRLNHFETAFVHHFTNVSENRFREIG